MKASLDENTHSRIDVPFFFARIYSYYNIIIIQNGSNCTAAAAIGNKTNGRRDCSVWSSPHISVYSIQYKYAHIMCIHYETQMYSNILYNIKYNIIIIPTIYPYCSVIFYSRLDVGKMAALTFFAYLKRVKIHLKAPKRYVCIRIFSSYFRPHMFKMSNANDTDSANKQILQKNIDHFKFSNSQLPMRKKTKIPTDDG